jgi:RNA polymerase sigma factor (sigma-70 family)
MADDLPLPNDDLLRQTEWLRALACSLAHDAAAADDAAQESWLAALRRPPRDRRSLPGYLAVALHRALAMMRRGNRRRAARERAVALPANAAAEPAADLVARFELHRHLVALVLALPEPQRELILRHYFEGVEVAALSRRLSLSADAVRGHLRRARDALRAKLADGDERVRRGLALMLTTTQPAILPGAFTALGVTMKWKLTTAATAVAIAGLFAWQVLTPTHAARPTSGPTGAAPAVSALATPTPSDATGLQRTEVPADVHQRVVHCRLVGLRKDVPWTAPIKIDLDGKDVARDEWHLEPQQAQPDESGAFDLRLPPWTATCESFKARLRAEDPLYLDIDVRETSSTLAASPLVGRDIYEIPVQVVAVITGKVVDYRGEPVPAARISAYPLVDGKPLPTALATAGTNDEGGYVLQAPAAAHLLIVATPMHAASLSGRRMIGRNGAVMEDGRTRDDLLPAAQSLDTAFGKRTELPTFTLAEPCSVQGLVVWTDNVPIEGARLQWTPIGPIVLDQKLGLKWLGDHTVAMVSHGDADANGRFALAAHGGDRGLVRVERLAKGLLLPPENFGCDATAPQDVTVVVTGKLVTVRVLDPAGKPRRGSVEWSGSKPYLGRYATDEHGVMKLVAQPGRFLARAVADELSSDWLAFDTAPSTLELRLLPSDAAPVLLELVNELPIRQASLCWSRANNDGPDEWRHVSRSDGDGPFQMRLPPGAYRLQITPMGGERNGKFLLDQSFDVTVLPANPRLDLAVVLGGRIHLQVRDAAGLPVRGNCRVIAATGTEVTRALEIDGTTTTENLAVGHYEIVFDLGSHGVLRRGVDVKVCEVAEVKIDLP